MTKKLPLIIICVFALTAGVAVSSFLSTSNNQNSTSAASNAALTSLQESLKTSIALPLDFKSVPEFDLQDADGNPIDESVFNDQWSIVFFGYTHCPDVCPITLQIMKGVLAKLTEAEKTLPQVVFVTVDPVRDTPEVMKNYISYFDETFVGITGDMNKLHELTRSLGIVASFTANDQDPDNYIVDHTASLLLIDPDGRLRAKISPPHAADTITEDYLSVISAPS